MKIELTHRYSELDKKNNFGLVLAEGQEGHHYRWVWFYLGKLSKGKFMPYPFSMKTGYLNGKVIGAWKYHPAEKLAKLILNRVNKYLGK